MGGAFLVYQHHSLTTSAWWGVGWSLLPDLQAVWKLQLVVAVFFMRQNELIYC